MKTVYTFVRSILFALVVLSFTAVSARAQSFDWINFQSDIHGVAKHYDPNLVNPWGMAFSPSGNVWVNDNGTGVATVYYQDGTAFPNASNPLVVTIPPSGGTGTASPTGIVSNTTPFFKVTNGTNTLPARFIFVNEDGMISGWNPNLSNTQAFPARDNGATAVYKGATMGVAGGHNFLYVTNFKSGQVETYNENFQPVTGFPFTDPTIPADYAPFGIRNFNGQIFVTYAKRNPASPNDDLAGAHFGYVDVFGTHGHFIRRLISDGKLNAPWGLAIVNGALWVGNFGDGRINAYDPTNGTFLGTLRTADGTALTFDGLWDLLPGANGVFFSAGIADEEHGLFGQIF